MANEEREKEEQLGEISDDLLKEHGDNFPPGRTYYPGEPPADIASSAPLGDAPTVLGDRTRGASVRSTFDTRPINGTDFYYSETQEVTPLGESAVTATFTYTVPKSYIAVLRAFEFSQYPFVFDEDKFIDVSILVNGISQLGHSGIEFQQDAGKQPTHIIAPELSKLAIRLIYPASYSLNLSLSVWVHLYGNLILTKNQPAAFEVGNEEPTRPIPIPAELGGGEAEPVKKPPTVREEENTRFHFSIKPSKPRKPIRRVRRNKLGR